MLLLSAGFEKKKKKLTYEWPKCLMPIHGIPLLEYWLSALKFGNYNKVYVNSHSHSEVLGQYLLRKQFRGWVKNLYEHELLGTAASIRQHKNLFSNMPLLLIHSDNWTGADINSFVKSCEKLKTSNLLLSMLTFTSSSPELCGVVRVDGAGVVTSFEEKSASPCSNIANGAVYFLSRQLVNWICENESINDFSLDVIPNCVGKIMTWHNTSYHRDIGTLEALREAQNDPRRPLYWTKKDKWMNDFSSNPIHEKIKVL